MLNHFRPLMRPRKFSEADKGSPELDVPQPPSFAYTEDIEPQPHKQRYDHQQ